MSVAQWLVSQRRLVWTLTVLLCLAGVLAWQSMARQEDPTLPYRAALILAPFPGASAEQVERLLLEPLEEALASVSELDTVETSARTGVGVLRLFIRDRILDVDPVWDEVERVLRDLEPRLPPQALALSFDRDVFDTESIVLAITGTDDALALRTEARRLRASLLRMDDVSRVVLTADPGEEIRVTLDRVRALGLELTPERVAMALQGRNSLVPSGTLAQGDRSVVLDADNELATLDALRTWPLLLPDGTGIPLGDVAHVERTVADPIASRMRLDGRPAIAVGVVPRQGIRIEVLGAALRAQVADFSRGLPPGMEVVEVSFQPDLVARRLDGLQRSLLQSVLVVALVLVLFMGVRLGLTVAAVVPVVTLGALALWAGGGGALHQMSIAALVLALGMLVDNAIVVAEDVQTRLDQGQSCWDAARDAVTSLWLPLATATGTTVASFVPMLLAQGPTGDFTRAIPQMVILALVLSWLLAITLTPTLSALTLRPARTAGALTPRRGLWIGRLAVRAPWTVLALTGLLLAGAASTAGRIGTQFFPGSDREMILVDLTLADGTHIDATDRAALALEAWLRTRPEVASTATFVGNGAPHFYYNVVQRPAQPHLAQLMVRTHGAAGHADLMAGIRAWAARALPEADVVARRIEQGPPVAAPIEVRLQARDLDTLRAAADQVRDWLRAHPAAADVRHSLGPGGATLRWEVEDAVAARLQLTRLDVARALAGETLGLPAGDYRATDEAIPIRVRGGGGERTDASTLAGLPLPTAQGPVPLGALARPTLDWRVDGIERRNGERLVTVSAQLAPGADAGAVMQDLRPRMQAHPWPEGLAWAFGGEADASGDANAAILLSLPLGLALLLAFLMVEFNSFRLVMIVLATIPLAGVGILPGLAWTGQPFGFMSLLGLIALIGIVVNNAIVLLDVVGHQRRQGATVAEAVQGAVARRLRPILLSTLTTVLGLLPLALTESTLWPPLAWAMISGLLSSTVLTLFVIPALYRLLHRDRPVPPAAMASQGGIPSPGLVPALALVLAVMVPMAGMAETPGVLTLEQALARLEAEAPGMEVARTRLPQAAAVLAEARALWRPSVDVQAALIRNDIALEASFPNPLAALDPWLQTVSAQNPALPDASVVTGAPGVTLLNQNLWDARAVVQLTQPLWAPEAGPMRRLAGARTHLAYVGQDATWLGLREGLEESFFGGMRAQVAAQALGRNAAEAALELRRLEDRAALGAGRAWDIDRARIAWMRQDQAARSAQAQAAMAREAVAALLAGPAADLLALGTERDAEALSGPGSAPPWASRADVAVLGLQQSLLAAQADLVAAAGAPRALLQGVLAPQRTTDFQTRAMDWYVQVAVSWQAWDGGRRRAQRQGLEAAALEAAAAARERMASLDAAHRQAWWQVEEATQRQALARAELDFARDGVERARQAWELGAAGRLEVDQALELAWAAELGVELVAVDVQAALHRVARLQAGGRGR